MISSLTSLWFLIFYLSTFTLRIRKTGGFPHSRAIFWHFSQDLTLLLRPRGASQPITTKYDLTPGGNGGRFSVAHHGKVRRIAPPGPKRGAVVRS